METKVLLVFENKKYIDKINNDKITIKDFIKNTVEEFNNNINEYFILKNGSLILPSNQLINTNSSTKSPLIYITCYRKIKGGGFIDIVLSPLELFLKPIFEPIKAIVNVFVMIIKLIVWLVLFIIWFLQFMIWLFTDLLNPANFLNDFFKSIMMIIIAIFSSIFNIIMALLSIGTNTIGNWMQGFWGWDQSGLTKEDKESIYFKKINRNKGKKAYLTNTNTVPFSVILGTILCPPVGVFMDMGLTGWVNILVCCLLTLLFYVPGLFYALLIIYS